MTEKNDEKSQLNEAYAGVHDGAVSILEGTAIFARHLWNLKMRLMVRIGIMPIFRGAWWLFIIEAFILLAVAMPLGVIFVIMGFCAMNHDPRAEDDFIVPLRRSEPF